MIILLFALLQEEAIRDALPRLEKGSIREAYAAVESLAKLGPSAIPALKKAAETAAEPAKRRLAIAIDEIEAERTFKDFYAQPKRLSLKGEKRSLLDLLGELKNTSGESIDFQELAEEGVNKEVTLDLKDVTFLEAFDFLCKEGDLIADRDGNSYYLYKGQYDAGPRFFFRNFMVTMSGFESVRTVDFEGPPRSTLRLNFDLSWDRQVRPLGVKEKMELDYAVDDKGKNLLLPPRDDTHEPEPEPGVEVYTSWSNYATAPEIAPVSEGATKIAHLRGSFLLEFPRTFDTFSFEKPQGSASKTVGEATLTLASVRFDNDSYEWNAEFSLKAKSGKPSEWVKDPLHITLKLKTGVILDAYDCQTRFTDEEVLFTVRFTERWTSQFSLEENEGDDDADDIEAVTVLRLRDVVVKKLPFELQDIEVKK